ncbi:hypothetical protein J5J01_00400 [Streptomyces fradiae]|uniref:DUF6233 domain-containing protein n=1 Tax=Streptomyces fradiae TaxID=1906 RepID=UPI0020184ABA|nr:DUF6233 domain-containing protein [Streptomyces fradiae]UQS30298.1 hypothetical protein J5J01_00400 [Streptomyces fradiae]
MTNLPPDLPRLRTLATWLELTLAHVRQAIVEAERREREQERQRNREARSPAADWLLESGIGDGPAVYVHVGGCSMAGKRSRGIPRDVALRALAEVDACPHCRPDAELGYLDG